MFDLYVERAQPKKGFWTDEDGTMRKKKAMTDRDTNDEDLPSEGRKGLRARMVAKKSGRDGELLLRRLCG
jgi:hypothetical protein